MVLQVLLVTVRIAHNENQMRRVLPRLAALILFTMFVFTGCGHSASEYVARGRELSAKQQYAEAVINYRNAIQRDPKFGEAYYQLGLTEVRLNQRQEAFQNLSRAADLLPDRDDVKVTLGDFSFNTYLADRARPKVLYDTVTSLADQLLAKDPKSY